MKDEVRLLITLLMMVGCGAATSANFAHPQESHSAALLAQAQNNTRHLGGDLQSESLCAKGEHILFSCAVKRSAKFVSLCAAPDLTKDRGYVQYRFGLPGKIELEFPSDRQGSQQKFHYSHYFRYQVDLTEVTFEINGYLYSIFDNYNGEEKPAISSQGVSVTAPGKPKDISFVCRGKPKADYSTLPDVLAGETQ